MDKFPTGAQKAQCLSVNGKKQFKRGFVLYNNLFMENKIGSFMFYFIFNKFLRRY